MNKKTHQQVVCIIFSLLFPALLVSNKLIAKGVKESKAKQVAINKFSKESGFSKASLSIKNVIPFETKGDTLFRIFNLNPQGYIVVSADDNTEPILGYGLESNFDIGNVPPALMYLLNEYKKEIVYIKELTISRF